jgi:hypothetical protein
LPRALGGSCSLATSLIGRDDETILNVPHTRCALCHVFSQALLLSA